MALAPPLGGAVGADAEKGGQGTQLDIRDEALACLDALHGFWSATEAQELLNSL